MLLKTVFSIILSCLFFGTAIFAQSDTIYLKNPSFEGIAREEWLPKNWQDCGFEGESAPDTQPCDAADVQKKAVHGDTYIGMVTRDNDTWESIGQQLEKPLQKGQCYVFKLSLCQTAAYNSLSQGGGEKVIYDKPVKLLIWGGQTACDRMEKLAETNPVSNTNWLDYVFTFQPTADYEFIKLEAYYDNPLSLAYNGNILIDKASPIIPVPCDSLEKWKKTQLGKVFSSVADASQLILHDESFQNEASPNTAIYFNAALGATKQQLVIEKIQLFVKNNPRLKANIIIEETTKKAGKKQRKYLLKALEKLGVKEKALSISVFRS